MAASPARVISADQYTRRSGRRVLRTIGRRLAALFGLIVVLGLVGAGYEAAAEAADVRAYPPLDSWLTWAAIVCTSTAPEPAAPRW